VASSLAAGVAAGPDGWFGTADDARPAGPDVTDRPDLVSRVGAVFIGGQAVGTVQAEDHFGFAAEHVGIVRVGTAAVPLKAGAHNDLALLGPTSDLTVREV
jgi:hypothetical protein